MQFIDTHIHLQDIKSNNTTEIIREAERNGCLKMVCISATEEDWPKVANLAQEFSETVVPAFAIHPWYATQVKENWHHRLESMLERFPNALIGECGLDGLKQNIDIQKQIFIEQISLAKKFNRPLIIHAVKAVPLMEMFWDKLPPKFVLHGFNHKHDFLQKILKYGGYIGIGSGLLKTPKAQEILKQIPLNKLLVESDAPYQARSSYDILTQIEQIAAMRGEETQKLAQQIYLNSLEFIK